MRGQNIIIKFKIIALINDVKLIKTKFIFK